MTFGNIKTEELILTTVVYYLGMSVGPWIFIHGTDIVDGCLVLFFGLFC